MTRVSQSISLRRSFAVAAVLSFGLFIGPVKGADSPEIHVALGAEEIFIGESVVYQVEIRNAKNPTAPDLSAIKEEFDVASAGEESRNQTSVNIINGRVSQQNIFSHIYQFQLTPRKAGNLKIPSATATIEGKELTSNELPLRVIATEKQDLVLVEIETSQSRVYQTQPFTVMLRILIQPLSNDVDRDPLTPLRRSPPQVQLNWADPPPGLVAEDKSRWLQSLVADDGVGFTLNNLSERTGSIFDGPQALVFNFFNGREIRDGIDGKPIRYFVYELARTLTPEKCGTYSLGPAVVKGKFVAGFEGNQYKGRRLVTSAPAVSVEVREVPSPRPATYCGAIGKYTMTASASPSKLRVGDPLTLTLELERGSHSGSLGLVSAPDLSAMSAVVSDFDLIDTNPTGRVEGNVKKFSYAMRPRHAGINIPSLTVSTFDPKSERFENLETATIPLDVTEAAHVTSGDLVGTRPGTGPTSIKTRAEGIFQNITDPSEVRDERISLIAWSEAAMGIWCAAGCLIAVVTFYRSKTSDAVWVRRQQARRTANRRLAEARALVVQGKSTEALRLVRMAIVGLVADTRNRIAEGLTTADVVTELATVSVPIDDRTKVSHLLDSIESAAYGAADSADAAAAIETAAGLMARSSPYLERGS